MIEGEGMDMRRAIAVSAVFLFFVALFAQDADVRPVVKDIMASHVADAQVRVSWRLPQGFSADAILVFKGTQPFSARQQVAALVPVAQVKPNSSFFVDRLADYDEYYYAVIAKKADGTLYDVVLPSINATVTGIRARRPEMDVPQDTADEPEKQYAAGQMRELPLPYLALLEGQRKPNPLRGDVLAAGAELAGACTEKRRVPLDPYIFEEDMFEPAGGDEYFLFEILKDHFVRKDYQNAIGQLRQFLGVNRKDDVTDRAIFYLAESYYYRKNYRQALNLFLFIEESVPAVSKKWIESTLDLYQLPEERQ